MGKIQHYTPQTVQKTRQFPKDTAMWGSGVHFFFWYDSLHTYKLLSQNILLSSPSLWKLRDSGSMKTENLLLKQTGHKNAWAISW